MGWTDERVDTLKKLWLDGLSATQIAKQLGGVTRNAVIGKVHRLGMSGRAAPSAPRSTGFKPPRPSRPAAPRVPRIAKAVAAAAVVEKDEMVIPFVELSGTATSLTLGSHMCKWPIGDPESDDFSFCGRRAPGKSSFCEDHARVAYQPHSSIAHRRNNNLERSLRRYI